MEDRIIERRLNLSRVFCAVALVAILGVGSVLTSCQRDPIVYATSDYYLQIGFGEGVKDFTVSEQSPEMWVVYGYNDKKLSYETFLRANLHPASMPYGGYLTGFSAGPRTLLAFNYDSGVNHFDGNQNQDKLRVTTEVLNYSNGVAIVRAPTPLYLYRDEISVPFITVDEDTYIINGIAKERTETWTVIVRGIRKIENIDNVSFYLSGQQRGCYLGKDEIWDERAILFFSGKVINSTLTRADEYDNAEKEIRAVYSTFGRQYDVDKALLTVQITATNGYQYYIQKDVTDIVADPVAESYTIFVDGSDIEIADKTDGGFDPSANEWQPDVTEINLS